MLKIPPLLQDLIDAGRWPRTPADMKWQNFHSWVSRARVQLLAPEEIAINFLPPPFRTVREECEENALFWNSSMAAPEGIEFDLTLVIGDFGIGSDAPILLDYSKELDNPRVLRLLWPNNGKDNKWVVMATDFKTFADVLGL